VKKLVACVLKVGGHGTRCCCMDWRWTLSGTATLALCTLLLYGLALDTFRYSNSGIVHTAAVWTGAGHFHVQPLWHCAHCCCMDWRWTLSRTATLALCTRCTHFLTYSGLLVLSVAVTELYLLWSELSRCKLSTSATADYSSPDNAIGLVAQCELSRYGKLDYLLKAAGQKFSHIAGNPVATAGVVRWPSVGDTAGYRLRHPKLTSVSLFLMVSVVSEIAKKSCG